MSDASAKAAAEPQHEHEFEPEYGLPEPLPAGEHVLWQGSPQWRVMARRLFHVRKLTLYFAIILLARSVTVLSGGGTTAEALTAAAWLLAPVLLALGMVMLMAWMSARTTVYTITDQRVVMRIGIVLSLTFNLPFKSIASASLRRYGGGIGDIPLLLAAKEKIAYVHLWPHARPWRLAKPEPMLCCVSDSEHVAQILVQAWAAATHSVLEPVVAPVPAAVHPGVAAHPPAAKPQRPVGGVLAAN